MTLGEQVCDARKRLGWSQCELATRVGVSSAQISRIEDGKRSTDAGTLARLVRILGLDPAAALAAVESPSPEPSPVEVAA